MTLKELNTEMRKPWFTMGYRYYSSHRTREQARRHKRRLNNRVRIYRKVPTYQLQGRLED